MNIIIKNRIEFFGKKEEVNEIIESLKSEKSLFDFNKLVLVEDREEDLAMDDYMCACLNVYMKKFIVNKANFVKLMRFVGYTRMVPYSFRILSSEELEKYQSEYKTKRMIKEANRFLRKVYDTSIFNNYIIRETLWGTGSGADKVRVQGNKIEFTTYYTAPIKLIEIIANKYPNIKMYYECKAGEKITQLYIKNKNVDIIKSEATQCISAFDLINKYINENIVEEA